MATARLVKGGLIVLASHGGAVHRTVALQYNPETLTRSFEPHGEGGTGAQPFRFSGAATEWIQLVAVLDATDALEQPEAQAGVMAAGIGPQLAVLESLVQPSAAQLMSTVLRPEGTPEVPLVLFTWGAHRVVPVRVTQLSIVEEAFDHALNPLRARVSLTLRVLTTDDFGPTHRGAAVFLAYLRGREALAQTAPGATLEALGLRDLP